jgi:hypothetical protein
VAVGVIATGATMVTRAIEWRKRGTGVWLAEASRAGFIGSGAVAVVIAVVGTSAVAGFSAGDSVQGVGIVVCRCGGVGVCLEGSSSEAGLFVVRVGIRGVAVVFVLFVLVERCGAEGCTRRSCREFASVVVVSVEVI